jgi:hypothetical protein
MMIIVKGKLCPNCKGKGHVMCGAVAFVSCLTVMMIPLIFFEKNDPNGITRISCGRCDGKGYVRL